MQHIKSLIKSHNSPRCLRTFLRNLIFQFKAARCHWKAFLLARAFSSFWCCVAIGCLNTYKNRGRGLETFLRLSSFSLRLLPSYEGKKFLDRLQISLFIYVITFGSLAEGRKRRQQKKKVLIWIHQSIWKLIRLFGCGKIERSTNYSEMIKSLAQDCAMWWLEINSKRT